MVEPWNSFRHYAFDLCLPELSFSILVMMLFIHTMCIDMNTNFAQSNEILNITIQDHERNIRKRRKKVHKNTAIQLVRK